jgi:hypothetical protein
MGSRNVPDRNKVFFGIPNADVNLDIDYARDEAIKNLERQNQELQEQIDGITATAPAAPTAASGNLFFSQPATGFPVSGLSISGTPIQFVSVLTNRLRTTALYDETGTLGLGANTFIGGNYYRTNSTGNNLAILAYNAGTGSVSNLGFAAPIANNAVNWSAKIIGDTLYFKRLNVTGGSSTIYAWRLSSGWTTISVTVSGNMSTAIIGGSEKIIYSTGSGTPRWFYIDPTTLTETAGANMPGSSTYILGYGPYLWTDMGHTAVASTTPTWTQVHPTMSLVADFDDCRVAVSPTTGNLHRIARFTTGSPAVTAFGLEMYSRSISLVTQTTNVFTATGAALDGEPINDSGSSMPFIEVLKDDEIYIGGAINAQVTNPSSSSSGSVGAVWVSDGYASNRVLQESYGTPVTASPAVAVGLDINNGSIGVHVGIADPPAGTSGIANTSYITAIPAPGP